MKWLTVALLIFSVLTPTVVAQDPTVVTQDRSEAAWKLKNPRQPLPQVAGSYVIGADDTLSISVGKDLDLTNTQPVRADGMISMPLVGDVQAAGFTPMQLAASIMEKLKKYIEVPHVTVVLTKMSSHPKFLLGLEPIRDLEDSPQGPTISVPR